MHQLSFVAFAAAQQARTPVLPVHFEDLLFLQRSRKCADCRYGDHWFMDDADGYCLDAPRNIPVGGHYSVLLDECVYVVASEHRQ